jgi:DNA-binding MarR family transcriptional regulator
VKGDFVLSVPDRADYLLFGGTFVLANKLQVVGDNMVDGLSTKRWFLIRTILDLPSEPPPTITQIAREMDSTRQNVAKMLETMERDGLVTLESADFDRRSRRVRVTELARSQARQVAENAEGFLKRLFEGLEQRELEAAGKVILKLIENLTEMQDMIRQEELEI